MSSITAKERDQIVFRISCVEALKYGTAASLAFGAATFIAAKKSRKFDLATSISAKFSFPVMAFLGTFSYVYEVTAYDAQLHPQKYGLERLLKNQFGVEAPKVKSTMPIHHQIANSLADHPFHVLGVLGTGLAVGVFRQQNKNPGLPLSQKLMHSRVIVQFGVISMLLVTMGFKEYMDKRGRFVEPSEGESRDLCGGDGIFFE